MKYYKAQIEMYEPSTRWTLIKNELVTESERKKRFPTLPDFLFKEIEIPTSNTFYIFGVRYEKGANVVSNLNKLIKEYYNGR